MSTWDINDLYSQTTLIKARQLVAKNRVVQDEKPTVFHVQGSTSYRVQIEPVPIVREGAEADVDKSSAPWLTCSCPNGMARGGRPSCYHTAAVLLMIAEHPEILTPDEDDEDQLNRGAFMEPNFWDDRITDHPGRPVPTDDEERVASVRQEASIRIPGKPVDFGQSDGRARHYGGRDEDGM